MLGLVEVVIDKFGRDGIRPGDMFISNDPFVGRGSHLPDIALLAPVFLDGELALFVGNIAHHADIGGMAAGSMAGGMTEIYQEGLRIPPIRLVRERADRGRCLRPDPPERAHSGRAPRRLSGADRRQQARRAALRGPAAQMVDGARRRGRRCAHRRNSEPHARARIAELPDGEYQLFRHHR